MDGIDVSNWQKNIDITKVPGAFVIVKATQGSSYVSPAFQTQVRQTVSSGKLLGVYHYANGSGCIAEADHFIETVKDVLGRAILCLDWEGEQNKAFKEPNYALSFLRYVENKTGITPFIYMSKSVCRQYRSIWDPKYPLWCAQYPDYTPTGYKDNPWTDTKGFGAWSTCKILQYSSVGRIAGFNGNLDLDKAYISKEDWIAYAQGKHPADTSFYEKGKVYTLQDNMYIRKEPGGDHKFFVDITLNAKANGYADTLGYAILKKGTRVTCLDTASTGASTWIKIPSGWICGKTSKKTYVM